MLIRNKTFWIATALFILVAGGLIWLAFPPLLTRLHDQKLKLTELSDQITKEQQYLATIKKYNDQADQITSLSESAQNALPTSNKTELLLLQLDGLLSSLGLSNLTITSPFGQGVGTSSTTTSSNEVKAGGSGGGSAQPVVTTEKASGTFTLSGETGFIKTKELLVALRLFTRWNKITSLSITQSSDKVTLSLVSDVFVKADVPKDFSGQDPELLTKAALLFNQYKSYSTTPTTTEGQFGRTDPFAQAR